MDKNNNPFIPETVAYMPIQKDDPYYKMDHKHRGWAYIFNHNTFTDHEERVGTEKDVNRLKKTLQNLKFAVHIFEDLPYEGVMDRLHQAATSDHTDRDCFLVAFLTHGGQEGIIWAKDRSYNIQDVVDKFLGNMAPTLTGKPKIIITQSCKGNRTDPGITLVNRLENYNFEMGALDEFGMLDDSCDPGFSSSKRQKMDRRKSATYQLPVTADFIVVHATFPGYYAFRNSKGSHFISTLCEELIRTGNNISFEDILKTVNRRVATEFTSNHSKDKDKNNKKQMPCYYSTLTRILQFK